MGLDQPNGPNGPDGKTEICSHRVDEPIGILDQIRSVAALNRFGSGRPLSVGNEERAGEELHIGRFGLYPVDAFLDPLDVAGHGPAGSGIEMRDLRPIADVEQLRRDAEPSTVKPTAPPRARMRLRR
jgi:hypothetical protein